MTTCKGECGSAAQCGMKLEAWNEIMHELSKSEARDSEPQGLCTHISYQLSARFKPSFHQDILQC